MLSDAHMLGRNVAAALMSAASRTDWWQQDTVTNFVGQV
jgi:hypothetical protein